MITKLLRIKAYYNFIVIITGKLFLIWNQQKKYYGKQEEGVG